MELTFVKMHCFQFEGAFGEFLAQTPSDEDLGNVGRHPSTSTFPSLYAELNEITTHTQL